MLNTVHIIALPSFIHRVGGDNSKLAKEIAQNYECEIKRIRRSRNWQLVGKLQNIQTLLAYLKSDRLEQLGYLINKIDQILKQLDDKPESKETLLHDLLQQQPNMTLAELMHYTDCTLSEARLARDNASDF